MCVCERGDGYGVLIWLQYVKPLRWNWEEKVFVKDGMRERGSEHMEGGKSEMSRSTSWNVSPVFY